MDIILELIFLPILDFKEIPKANTNDGDQDTFELFARDFLEYLGFNILEGPDRGQDGGRDLIVQEQLKGISSIEKVNWLVSCKHYTHSGNSVLVSHEEDIIDRLHQHNAEGFIGFYSTTISASLGRKLQSYKESNKCKVLILDKERIEKLLLEKESGIKLAERYFPSSIKKYLQTAQPSIFLSEYYPLKCMHCEKDLLQEGNLGNLVFVYQYAENHSYQEEVEMIYWSCKGKCDRKLESMHTLKGYYTSHQEISHLIIPGKFIHWYMVNIDDLAQERKKYSEHALNNLKDFIIMISQKVLRHHTKEERKKFNILMELTTL